MTEYKTILLENKFSMQKAAQSLEEMLNAHARLGWKFKFMAGLYIILEKD